MANIYDVAKYILETQGPMTAVRLHQLVYYTQVWSLLWDEKALFHEEIEAWIDGAQAPTLIELHPGIEHLSTLERGDSGMIEKDERHTVNVVLELYEGRSTHWLCESICSEVLEKEQRTKKKPPLND